MKLLHSAIVQFICTHNVEPPIGGHLTLPQDDILYTNEPRGHFY